MCVESVLLSTKTLRNKVKTREHEYQPLAPTRIMNEFKKFVKDPPLWCSAGPVDGDLYHWQGMIFGPPKTPYDGGVFLLIIHFPLDYPCSAPKVEFRTKVFHPNIDSNGTFRSNVAFQNWTPSVQISKFLLCICSLLWEPDLDDPLVPKLAKIYVKDRAKYDKMARSWTMKYATVE